MLDNVPVILISAQCVKRVYVTIFALSKKTVRRTDFGFYSNLAYNWAPISYQYVSLDNDDYETKKDLLCPVNFGCYGGFLRRLKEPRSGETSRCWDTRIVRERLREADFQDLIATAYYSVADTDTHYFILYAYYHADDDTHPNDLEGCLLILEKNETRPILLGMITVAHHDFVPFVYNEMMKVRIHPPWQWDFKMEVEEELEGDHPLIQQSEGKHALYALGSNIGWLEKLRRRFWEIVGRPEDVIVYYPGKISNLYSKERLYRGKGTPHNPTFYYELIDILDGCYGLWNKYVNAREYGGNLTFTQEGAFQGGGPLGTANGPWLWESQQLSGKVQKSAMWNDPAAVADQMFEPKPNRKKFSTHYSKKMID